MHNYRLEYKTPPAHLPPSPILITALLNFSKKYSDSNFTIDDKSNKGVICFSSENNLEQRTIKEELPGFQILGFYEIASN